MYCRTNNVLTMMKIRNWDKGEVYLISTIENNYNLPFSSLDFSDYMILYGLE
jgi:hypothetical protein